MEEEDKAKQIEEESGYIPTGGLLEEVKRRNQSVKPGNAIIKSGIVEEQPLGKQAENLVVEPIKATLVEVRSSRKPLSPARLEANRRNGKLSTGPRTEQGKKWSSRNAAKHGILTSGILIDNREDKVAFRELLGALRLELKPSILSMGVTPSAALRISFVD